MKISCAAATLFLASSAIGSTSAAMDEVVLSEPVPFTQYDGGCPARDDPDAEQKVLYKGSINSIKKLGESQFCVVDNVPVQGSTTGETELAFSKLMVVGCESEEVIDHWYKCTDDTCADCEIEYRSTTSWDSFDNHDIMEHCYVYHFSMDSHETVKASRNAPLGVTGGAFENLVTVSYNFDQDANPDDVTAYMDFVHDNSCIANGPPPAESAPELNKAENDNKPAVPVVEATSGSSAVAAASVAAAAATLATSMMLL